MMMLAVHPQNPQTRLIRMLAQQLQNGKNGVIVYPTDSSYAFGCLQNNADAIRRMRTLRGVGDKHLFALACRDIGQIGDYAAVDNAAFRLMKKRAPGAYTFILPAAKKVASRLCHPKRKTVAFRVPAHPVAAALLAEVGEPIITTTLKLKPGGEAIGNDELQDKLRGLPVDAICDAGPCPMTPTTMLDFTKTPPELLRLGGGEVGDLTL